MTSRVPKISDAKMTFVNFREIGLSLREMGSDVIKTTHQNVVSRWYHSDADADVILWKDERENIIKQQVNLFGQIIEWNIVEGLKTGFVVETEGPNGQVQAIKPDKPGEKTKTANVVQYDATPSKNSINQAIEIIKHARLISKGDKEILINNFYNAPRIASMDPTDFVNKYGKPIKENFFKKWIRRFFK